MAEIGGDVGRCRGDLGRYWARVRLGLELDPVGARVRGLLVLIKDLGRGRASVRVRVRARARVRVRVGARLRARVGVSGLVLIKDLPAAQEEVVLRLVHLLGTEQDLGADLGEG